LGGDVVAGLSRTGAIGIWDAVTGDQLGPISQIHSDKSWRLGLDDTNGLWSASEDGALHRLDLVDRTMACALTEGVFDTQRQAKFLSGDALQSCG
jgi:hypothetical protein